MPKKKGSSVGQSIGGIIAGFDQQIFRTTPPVNELVAKGDRLAPVAASGGGTMSVGLPDEPDADPAPDATGGAAPDTTAATADESPGVSPGDRPDHLLLSAPGVTAVVDLAVGGRIASLMIGGRELLRTSGDDPIAWGSFPMAPYAGRVRDARLRFSGRTWSLPVRMPPHALHGTVLDRPWQAVDGQTIATDLGSDWPFAGRVVQRFELASDHLTCRMELTADEPMPASMGWHPWFLRRLPGVAAALELELDARSMYRRDEAGIATSVLISPPPGPWDDCFTDLRRPPVLRWPGFLELAIESDCRDWVVYTEPEDALCVEPQTAPPDAVNTDPTVVHPGRPLTAEMTWRWRTLAR